MVDKIVEPKENEDETMDEREEMNETKRPMDEEKRPSEERPSKRCKLVNIKYRQKRKNEKNENILER